MTFHILTIFPHIFDSYFNESILKRAQKNGLIQIRIYNLRDWTEDKHKTVDDTPYGGGAGMVMKADVVVKALIDIVTSIQGKNYSRITRSEFPISNFQFPNKSKTQNTKHKTILFSAKGKKWDETLVRKYSKLENIIMICGRYEGVDERVKKFADEEISIGDYVLTGGEIPAMAIVDSITRLIPGVLGNKKSLDEESFNKNIDNSRLCQGFGGQAKFIIQNSFLEYPQYTRPEILEIDGKKLCVPKILLSGDHKKIDDWRKKKIRK